VISVFKHGRKGPEAALDILMPRAVAEGGRRLDCFNIGGGLPILYSAHGFIPVAKVHFDPEMAPQDWGNLPEVDIIFMIYVPDDPISKKDKKERGNLIEDILRKMSYSSYIEAVAKQESELQKIRG